MSTPGDEDDEAFEEAAQRADEEAKLDNELEETFPASDPPPSWSGSDDQFGQTAR
jgi:hypothetical protein